MAEIPDFVPQGFDGQVVSEVAWTLFGRLSSFPVSLQGSAPAVCVYQSRLDLMFILQPFDLSPPYNFLIFIRS